MQTVRDARALLQPKSHGWRILPRQKQCSWERRRESGLLSTETSGRGDTQELAHQAKAILKGD